MIRRNNSIFRRYFRSLSLVSPFSIVRDLKIKWQSDYPYRAYTKKYECIFIHIPKTAGTSILNALQGKKVNRDHCSFHEYSRSDVIKYSEFFKFTFVRNPYDRAVSTYEYLKRGGNQIGGLYFKELINKHYPTFEMFVLDYLDKEQIQLHKLFKPQYLFIYDHKLECQVDEIFYFENIEESYSHISQVLKLNVPLKCENKVVREHYLSYYKNRQVVEKINYLYSKDFDLFGYDKI
ncbi:sulfotransferase family 2 domain-containing protein [Thalassotalea sp. PS06]|uniref:sulfotransferase family 2 domain-containing protein n=1 Tax=Thalassotalea sp. PS06 TaxID=2594005 RepID=UPI001163BB37|nr:sulfotransferase family 2 domain-containing protein [Thalassotalea sp. PS06]QDP01989.1 sulfotransferase family protein [Thalassotalea sp. PS06]